MDIGSKIKNLRIKNGMTLKELSEKCDLSIGFLSQLERGLTTIAVDSLEKIANIFDVQLTYFFDLPQKKDIKILRSYEKVVLDVDKSGFIHYLLTTNVYDKSFVPRLIEILPHKEDEEITCYNHKGEEFVYVLEGILTLYLHDKKYELYPGDSIHMMSTTPHNWANFTNKKVKILVVHSPNNLT
ncbi:HTH-type transcriptional regulator PuuR [Clostridium tepidiprofundi DSM 19306]|uniref:HTH-type transcriptional regulator PuuR n=1 Tax=Clostridium tepidiprofundi DSM 19306 TaxID=1121338 RepID=A0A151B8K9_9CLOT|nr:XRE family transcriptional regulator [Clostridium tepidiprofundi]KYH35977.1 HTH-type transcriptional regulator PuuR [Clostridium tepidiprofundi DSM 19306]